MERGLIFNFQRFSLQDGPGIRTTVFLKGCPLRCTWCHNPEGISPRRELVVVESRCVACGECRRVCRYAGERQEGAGAPLSSRQACELCGACVQACPTTARQIIGREITVAEVLEVLSKDRIFYEDSRGGVTFSGGEPLAQPAFLCAALAACRAQGLHTAVDTCGQARTEHLLAVARWADLFLYDLKMIDPARHREFTGVSNELILSNLAALGRVHDQIWVRVPVIPGVNDDPAALQSTARFAASIPGVRQVNLLPFHATGLPKLARLGRPNKVGAIRPPTSQMMEAAVAVFNEHGLAAKAGG